MTLNFFATKGDSHYLIYEMIGKKISFKQDKEKEEGVLELAYRDFFHKTIVMRMADGKVFVFNEPDEICRSEQEIVFLYGKKHTYCKRDKTLFREAGKSSYRGETVDDVIKRTVPTKEKKIRFTMTT